MRICGSQNSLFFCLWSSFDSVLGSLPPPPSFMSWDLMIHKVTVVQRKEELANRK